jgi:electron transfer flavoprotein alpha subunit
MNVMNIVVIGDSLEEIIVSCGGTMIENIKNGGNANIIVTNEQTYKNKIQKTIEKSGINVNVIKNFDFLITTQNNVKLIQKYLEKYKPDTIIIPHNKSKKKKKSVLGSSSILAGRQIKNILMYETDKMFNHTPTIFHKIQDVEATKIQWINMFNENQRNTYKLFLNKINDLNKKNELKQEKIEPYHSFRMMLE